jgi:hypothetical protein
METTRQSANGRPAASRIPPISKLTRRSRITNGKQLFAALRNGNTAWARRVHDLMSMLASDIAPERDLSEAKKMLIRRCAFIAIQMEAMEQQWAEHDGIASEKSLMSYQRLAGALRRLLQTLGLERRAKNVGPTLGELLRQPRPTESGDVIDG